MRKFLFIVFMVAAFVLPSAAQIDVSGYTLVYSSETPERAGSLLNLTTEELANCTGDFTSKSNLERNWSYSPKATSEWNKRMATTDEQRALVHKVQNGHLRLLAVSTDGTANGFITSGVNMKNSFKYGIFEIKAKCNPHKSNFPAIWMMPKDQKDGWPNCGEIDIMEQIGNSGTVWSTVHLGARYDKPVGKSYSYSGSRSFGSGYHIYSLLWTRTSLIFYCDGIQVFRYNKDTTLDIETNPDFEKWQFPYNKEFYIILDQALGKNAWWGSESPDPGFTYEMDVEYVRIWQAPETYEIDRYVLLKNYSDPTRYMMATDNLLTTTTLDNENRATADMIFGLIKTDSGGKYYLQTLSGKRVGFTADANKQVVLSESGETYYMIRDAEKGVAFDNAKNTAPFTYAGGSRALSLYATRNNIVVTSGTSKDATWWELRDIDPSVVTGIEANKGVLERTSADERARKIVRDGKIIIVSGGKKFTVVGEQIKD